MLSRRSFALLQLLGVLSLPLVSGCVTYTLEYDRMTRTAFPPPQTVSGDDVNLGTIYSDAGIGLVVDYDDTSIPRLTGPSDPADPNKYDYITAAELANLEATNRSLPVAPTTTRCFIFTCTHYHVYGIVVDHYFERADGTRNTGWMGVIYDTTNRGAVASFYRNATISGDGGKFLRSAAHELGHAFNLHHEEGDGSTTIMNQTGVVGSSYVYEFSNLSLTHLRDHPRNCVAPGTGPFGYINSAHTPHLWTTTGCS